MRAQRRFTLKKWKLDLENQAKVDPHSVPMLLSSQEEAEQDASSRQPWVSLVPGGAGLPGQEGGQGGRKAAWRWNPWWGKVGYTQHLPPPAGMQGRRTPTLQDPSIVGRWGKDPTENITLGGVQVPPLHESRAS